MHLLQKEIKLAQYEIIVAGHHKNYAQKIVVIFSICLPSYFLTFQCLLRKNRLCSHKKKASQPLISSFYYVFACNRKSISKGNCSGLAGYTKSSSREQGIQGGT